MHNRKQLSRVFHHLTSSYDCDFTVYAQNIILFEITFLPLVNHLNSNCAHSKITIAIVNTISAYVLAALFSVK